MKTSEAFDEFDQALQLDVKERMAAISLHRQITTILTAGDLVADSFLQGSFRRKTMRSPLHDVDKVLILRDELRGLSPWDVMGRIETALRPHFPGIAFERTRHSLKLHLPGQTFTFDAVPAFEMGPETDDVLIANTETGGWDRSNTRHLIRVVQDRNKAMKGHFVVYVREIKQAAHNLLNDQLPGLHVESIAYLAMDGFDKFVDHPSACQRIFEIGGALLGGQYTDPTGADVISTRLDPGIALHARDLFADASLKAGHALALAEGGDHEAAMAIWFGIFGDPFPKPATQSAGAALGGAFAGFSVDQGGRVRSEARTHQRAIPTRAWRP